MKRFYRLFAAVLVACTVSLLVCGIFTKLFPRFPEGCTYIRAEDSEDGYATIYKHEHYELNVLVLTDTQTKELMNQYVDTLGGSVENTFVLIERLVKAANPDLVIITGDVAMSLIMDNLPMLRRYGELFESFEIYWTFAFGNHDCEWDYVVPEEQRTLELLGQRTKEYTLDTMTEEFPNLLAYSDEPSKEMGYGNHFINVKNYETDEIVYTLCVMDCVSDENDAVEDSYFRKKTDAQVDWYERNINKISDMRYGVDRSPSETVLSMIFVHVAVPETFAAFEAAYNGGEPNENYIWGHRLEGSASNSSYNECGLWEKAIELGSTKAIFSGHWHDNNFCVKAEDIYLVSCNHSSLAHYYRIDAISGGYDMSDIFEYGDERGGVLITIGTGSQPTFTLAQKIAAETIIYDDIRIDYEQLAANLESAGNEVVR